VTASSVGAERIEPSEPRDPRVTVGMIVFLASESLLFASFFGSYFALSAANETWPPAGTDIDVLRASVFTGVFVLSAATMALSLRAARLGRQGEADRWAAVTALLGLVFGVATFLELTNLDFGLTTDAYGSIFFITVGVHLLHVAAALLILAAAVSASFGRGRAPLVPGRSAAAYFWYFTVVMSVAVLVVFYWIQ
jgi:cytochrome c oxidase subunit III